jgi:hypothetical protein
MPITKVQQAGYNNNVFFKNVPYYTQFSPKSIGNCALWLDGADPAGNGVVPSAGNLTTWVDKSDSAINAIAGTSVYPQYTTAFLNGLGVVGLTSASDYFTVANNLNTSSLTYVFLMKPTAANTANTCGILSTDTAAQYGRSIALNNMVFQIEYYSGFTATSVTTNSSTWYIVSVVFNETSSITLSYNGTISTYAGSGTGTNSSGLTIGSYNSTNSYVSFNANFYLAEAIVYTSALSQTQFQNVESYLAQKWGLATSLAAGHLNSTFPAGSPEIIKNYISQVQINVTNIFYFISIMSTVYSLSTYSLANIANAVSAASGTAVYIWTVAVPAGAKSKNGILVLFFNLYSLTAFSASQYFDYGIYVDGTSQLLGDTTGTIRYVQTASGNYAMSSGGISLGTNGLGNGSPLVIPISFGAGASLIQIGLKNSLSALSTVSSTGLGYVTNVLTSSGTINTSNYIPQNTFTTVGASTYTVPTNTSAGVPVGVFIYCWGAGGCQAGGVYAGGSGGFVSGYYQCAPGTALYVVVGSIGSTSPSSGGGGTANQGNASSLYGGGFSGVFINGAAVQGNTICVAGGGGGAQNVANGGGGGGGYPAGGNGNGGTGGSQTVQGSPYNSAGANGAPAGTALLAASTYGNGAGGGGYWGGGCGNSGGGGGGSSYFGGLTGSAYENGGTILGSSTPSANVPGGSTSTLYQSGKGVGNAVANTTGTGLVVIIPAVGTNPCQIGVTAKLYSV